MNPELHQSCLKIQKLNSVSGEFPQSCQVLNYNKDLLIKCELILAVVTLVFALKHLILLKAASFTINTK